ncbi:MAG: hypothetical protein HYY16_05580, partial [Planctomycetes bacterium]|nr:hypothetical protein [Planctomycetota bacterium]
FYRPDVDFITGRWPDRDPLPAVVKFHEDLKALDIDLVVVPVPVKPSIYPERLAPGYDAASGPPVNSELSRFTRRLAERGVAVIDLTRDLWEARDKEPLYLPRDAHWTPQGMSLFAQALTRELRQRFEYLRFGVRSYVKRPAEVSNTGDILDMLRLPVRPKTTVTIEQVCDTDTGEPVVDDESSPVVLLGDSAVNIYSAENLRWGRHAGLAEHLCLNLGRPIHWIAVNGQAATQVRRRLLEEGLAGRRLVIWEFLARELTQADWETPPSGDAMPPEALPDRLEVKAKLVRKTAPPVADEEEIYPDTLGTLLYEIQEVLAGDYARRELLVVDWVQYDGGFTSIEDLSIGEVHHLILEPLRHARRRDDALRSAGTTDDVKRRDLPAFWVVERRR